MCGIESFRTPQVTMTASIVIKCVNQNNQIARSCSFPYRCTYSKILHNYICCKSTALKKQIIDNENYLINNKRKFNLIQKPKSKNKIYINRQNSNKSFRTMNQLKRLFFFKFELMNLLIKLLHIKIIL